MLLAVLFLVNPVGAEMSPDVAVFQERAEDVLLCGLEKMVPVCLRKTILHDKLRF